jgi:hypothetical protein
MMTGEVLDTDAAGFLPEFFLSVPMARKKG